MLLQRIRDLHAKRGDEEMRCLHKLPIAAVAAPPPDHPHPGMAALQHRFWQMHACAVPHDHGGRHVHGHAEHGRKVDSAS